MAKIRMKCSFTVYYTLEMEVSDDLTPEQQYDQLIDKVCNKHIFTYRQWDTDNNPFWHLDPTELNDGQITVFEADYDSDPSPTGNMSMRRDWEFEEVEDD